MPTRHASQRTGKIGERSVETIIDDHSNWLARRQDTDFGIDLEAELTQPTHEGQTLRGQLLKVQVKTGVKPNAVRSHIPIPVERAWVDYACQFRIPVILVGVTSDGKHAWWIWVQKWALLHEQRLAGPKTKTVTLRVSIERTLASGLDHELVEIAAGRDPAAMVLALRGVLAAASGWENAKVAEGIVELLGRTDYPSRDWTVRTIADKLLGSGPHVAYWQAQQHLPTLLALIRTAGDSLTQRDILLLVQRGEVYSRVGLNALGVLYDEWPEHTASLNLPSAFTKAKIKPVAWYAGMRERFLGQRSFGMFVMGLPDGDLECAGMCLRINSDLRDYLMAKWPNRGESVLLDCLFSPDSASGEVS